MDPTMKWTRIVREAEAKLAGLAGWGKARASDFAGRPDYGRAGSSEDQHDSELPVWNRNCSPAWLIRTTRSRRHRTANLWLAKNTIFTEAGAQLLADRSRWIKLVRRL